MESDRIFAIWAEVDTDANTEKRKFIIRGTGHPIAFGTVEIRDDQLQFINSLIVAPFVFHLWEYAEEGFTQPWE